MEKKGLPYGEARRLRYFTVICKRLLETPSVNKDYFIDKLLQSLGALNQKLSKYVRKTGVMRTRAVTRNYLSYANWLDFIQIENELVIPNAYTILLANLSPKEGFYLSSKEKIGFFLRFLAIDDFFKILSSLRINNSVRNFIHPNLSEHFVETYMDWFVDLDIVKPEASRFGGFSLRNLGYIVREACKTQSKMQISETYISKLLGISLKDGSKVSDELLWNSFQETLSELDRFTRSEVDSYLFSASPLILNLQIRLIYNLQSFVPLAILIKRLKDISPNYNTIFSWDQLANAGYFKIQR